MRNSKEKIESKYLSTKPMLLIRLLVAFYLLYTSYALFQGLSDATVGERIVIICGIIGFSIFSIFLLIHSSMALRDGRYKGGELDADADMDVDADAELAQEELEEDKVIEQLEEQTIQELEEDKE